ncbi:hypothetical protein [Roseateles sp. BYS87W]|uniref:Uncharacterized protein n=1 Tax=Pelomonas baiyunensis TaxID=3299026 RepID=A0ABW7GYW7_9BURK
MNITWWLLILAVALIALGVLRLDVLLARWRELVGSTPRAGTLPAEPPGQPAAPHGAGLHPHDAPTPKPGFHRSGHRH